MKITLSSILLIPIFFLSLYADERNSRDISKIGVKTEPVNGEIYEKIYYVSIQSGSDKTGDGSKANPWQSPTFALSIINDASESNKYAIFVAEGIYNSGTIVMKEWVDLYGGFDPKNWQRDIFKYRTILDGER
ncbi:MAG: hypothetical protein ONB13_11455, partial [candidate division KSB1 bacterium]|nr:hypothetical protein [candidate division KSB1 bacterium]